MFYDNVNNLCKQRQISITRMSEEIGLSNAAATSWRKGSVPKLDTVRKIANYFGVPMESLLSDNSGHTITASEHSFILQNNYGNNTVAQGDLRTVGEQFSDMELELLRIFRNLDLRKKNSALSYLYDLEDGGKEG